MFEFFIPFNLKLIKAWDLEWIGGIYLPITGMLY